MQIFLFLISFEVSLLPGAPGIAIIAGVTFRRKTMGNFKRDSAGGKAAGQMCEGKGNRGGSRNGSRDEALHAVMPGRYVDLTLDAGFKAVFADKGNKELLIGLPHSRRSPSRTSRKARKTTRMNPSSSSRATRRPVRRIARTRRHSTMASTTSITSWMVSKYPPDYYRVHPQDFATRVRRPNSTS